MMAQSPIRTSAPVMAIVSYVSGEQEIKRNE